MQQNMEAGEFDGKRISSVKAAISSYQEKILDGSSANKKQTQPNHSQKQNSRTRELRQVRRETSHFNESRRAAETASAQAGYELSVAKETVKDLTLRIEETKRRAKMHKRDLERLKMRERKRGEWDEGTGNVEDCRYPEVMRELESVKQELSEIKLDMASLLEEKERAEKAIDASNLAMKLYTSSEEELSGQIEEVNEEHVLVELARIEAVKEIGAIKAQREEAAKKHFATVDQTRKKMNEMLLEIEEVEELEAKMAMTTSDVNVLQNELKQVKEMEKRKQKVESLRYNEGCPQEGDISEALCSLESVVKELEVTKKELASIREEAFQFMASMDVVRNEIDHVTKETARLKKKEEKADLTIKNLNSKLLRAKAKLESASQTEEKAKSIVSNLSMTFEQLKSEGEAAKKEQALISEETALINAEIGKTESEIDLAEERLQAAIRDLKAAKASEAIALENLKTLIETTMENRASSSKRGSTITISKFEYDYLIGHAAGATEIADKKVAAAQAWIQALKAGEKEILIKTEIARRQARELRVREEEEIQNTGSSRKYEKRQENESLRTENAYTRKSMNRSGGKTTPVRRMRSRKSLSPAVRIGARSTSFTVRRRRGVMPNLKKFFSGRGEE